MRYNSKKPRILVDIGNDDPNRGDIHGMIGIAKSVARKTDGTFKVIKSIKHRINHLIKDQLEQNRYPDFIFKSPNIHHYPSMISARYTKNKKNGLLISAWNESMCSDLSIPEEYWALVPHHLTQEKLHSEGKKFAKTYKYIKRPLIGINLINIEDYRIPWFVEALTKALKDFKEATLFICPMHRTKDKCFKKTTSALEKEFSNSPFKVIKSKNSYVGLLDQADHIIIAGNSQSILSEALFTGKNVHVLDIFSIKDPISVHKTKRVRDLFNHHNLETNKAEPLNITDIIADNLITQRAALSRGNTYGMFDLQIKT